VERRGAPEIAVVGSGVSVRESRALKRLSDTAGLALMGLYADWHFAAADMITIYDGECWMGSKDAIPASRISHAVSGCGLIYPILGLADARAAVGRGGASFANSSRGLGEEGRPNCKLVVRSDKGAVVPYRALGPAGSRRAPPAHGVQQYLCVLVALRYIAPGSELLFDYRVSL
jgi:hypothetical protein